MIRHQIRLTLASIAALCLLRCDSVTAADLMLDCAQPACGKVCKLVCDTKTLTAIGYGCECKDICLPDPSREGCKHCAVCYGKCAGDPCTTCQGCPPKCTFCWRDWFACGCAQPRTIHVLTKYQAEKKICWYHWEVVDAAACCDRCGRNGANAAANMNAVEQGHRTIYKSAPKEAELGETLPVSEEEWVKLAAVLSPDPTEVATNTNVGLSPNSADESPGQTKPPSAEAKPSPLAERLQHMLKK